MVVLVVGSYERFLFGFNSPGLAPETQAAEDAAVVQVPQLPKRFTYAAHQNAVKCVAAGGHYLASGGGDDQIHLYDIKNNKDLGFLVNPAEGAVPCIRFFCPQGAGTAPSHMFSGSADGTIAVWQAGASWEHLKLMKGHSGSVNGIALHPSGRVALSVAHDRTLRMWDLTRGHCTYAGKLGSESEGVEFSPDGSKYLLLMGNKVTLHSVDSEGGVLATLEHQSKPTRVTCIVHQEASTVVGGLEDGSLRVWDVRSKQAEVQAIERAHAARVRGLVSIIPGQEAIPFLLGSASSDGVVRVWDTRQLGSGGKHNGAVCLAEAATRARITCLCAVDPKGPGALVQHAQQARTPMPGQQVKGKAQRPQQPSQATAGAQQHQQELGAGGSAKQPVSKQKQVTGKPSQAAASKGKGASGKQQGGQPVQVAKKPVKLGSTVSGKVQKRKHLMSSRKPS